MRPVPASPIALTRRTTGAAALLALTAACSSEPEARPAPAPSPSPSPTPTPRPSPTAAATPTPTPTASALPPVRDSLSLPTLMREEFDGGRLRLGRQVLANDAYRRWEVTYPAGDLTVSGMLLRPRGRGPFPAVVLNHGYIDPGGYVTGQGLMREQDALARAGFVVLHTDYRGHAASDPVSAVGRETRLGYTRDSLHAVGPLKRLPYVDPDRVAMLGRSMGGGVTLNALVAQPGAVRAAVLYASVSSAFLDNFRQFSQPGRPDEARAFFARFGSPQQDPDFYDDLSSRTFFDRVTEPVLIHHGTADDTCPMAWSRTTQRLLTEAGADATLRVYRGEQHAFIPQWPRSMDRTIAFLRRRLAATV